MAQNKTVETTGSVDGYLASITDPERRADCMALVDIFSKASGYPAKMWGTAIVGFGSYHYKYDSGREGDAPLAGFSSRAKEISLYLSYDFDKRDELLAKFGKHKTGKACIYIKNLADIDPAVLGRMVKASVSQTRKKYPG